MSDIKKAVLKVAKKNPEFRRALVAELKKESYGGSFDLEEVVGRVWAKAGRVGDDLRRKAREMQAKAIKEAETRGIQEVERELARFVDRSDRPFTVVKVEIASEPQQDYDYAYIQSSMWLLLQTVEEDDDDWRSAREWEKEIEDFLQRDLEIGGAKLTQKRANQWLVEFSWNDGANGINLW